MGEISIFAVTSGHSGKDVSFAAWNANHDRGSIDAKHFSFGQTSECADESPRRPGPGRGIVHCVLPIVAVQNGEASLAIFGRMILPGQPDFDFSGREHGVIQCGEGRLQVQIEKWNVNFNVPREKLALWESDDRAPARTVREGRSKRTFVVTSEGAPRTLGHGFGCVGMRK